MDGLTGTLRHAHRLYAGPRQRSLLQIRQLRSREPQSDRTRRSGFAIDESARLERHDHLMYNGRRDSEKAPKV